MAWDEQAYEDGTDPAYEEDSIARAVAKLRDLLAGSVVMQPVGWFVTPIVLAIVFAILPGLVFLYLAWSYRAEQGAWLALVMGTPLLLAGAWVIPGCRPNTPRRALTLFLKALARGQWKRARGLVVPNDHDGFPRFHPEDILPDSFNPFVLAGPEGYEHYWRPLLRNHFWPYCIVRLRKVKVEHKGPHVAVVTLRVTLMMNTRIWVALILVSLLIAAIIDAVTRKTVSADVTKILVRKGNEWHLFNGAWQGVEEEYPDWIEAEAG